MRNRVHRNRTWYLMISAAVITLIVAIFIAVGCGSEGDVGGTFTYAEPADPESIDPALVSEEVGWNIARYLFDGLVRYDSVSGEVVPAVAEEWEVNDDATEFTFKLRDDVTFTNGDTLVAGDFVYAWKRALEPNTASPMAMSILEPVQGATALAMGEADTLTGVEAVDDYTLKVTLEFPQAEFVTFLGHPVCAPIPEDAVDDNFADMPVGNGPFKVKEWKRGQEIVLEKNSDYYGDEAKLDQVVVKIIPDPATAVEELKAGNVDAVKLIPPGMDASLRDDENLKVLDGNSPSLQFAAFNISVEPWSDNLALRQAFTYAIDTETIAETVLQGQATSAHSIVPMGMIGHQHEIAPYSYDPEMAKTKLEEAGYPNGQGLPAITLSYPSDGPFGDVAQAMQSQLKEVGIEVELSGSSFGDFLDQMMGQQLSFFIITWAADYPSPDTFLYPLFHSDMIGPGAPNVSQYSKSEVDDLLDQARSTTDESERLKLYNEAEVKILDDAPVIPLVYGRDVVAYSTRVTNFVLTPLSEIALNEVTVSES